MAPCEYLDRSLLSLLRHCTLEVSSNVQSRENGAAMLHDKPKSQSKVQAQYPKEYQIQRRKGEFGLWAVFKILWA